MPPLRERYCAALNSLLRRELRVAITDARKSIAVAVASNAQDADLLNTTRWALTPKL